MPKASPAAPNLKLEAVLSILAPTRWEILRHLADGSALMVSELAERTGYAPSLISKQLAILRKAGIIIAPRARHLEIAPHFIADKTNRLLDFGWCLLRLNTGSN